MNDQQFGENPMLWMGQIVDDKYWKDNIASEKWDDYKKLTGWGYRYKVRIFGKHSEDKSIVPDERLPWAEVLYPVTAGSGHGASYQSSNLRKGAYVYGFYKDGIDRTGPIIIGCLPNADQTKLENTIPNTGFVPFSAFIGERVPVYSIPPGGSPAKPIAPGPSGTPTQGAVAAPGANSTADQNQINDAKNSTTLAVSSDCQQVPLGQIQNDIKKLLKDVQNKKKELYSWADSIKSPISDGGKQYSISEYIKYKIDGVAKNISKWLKGSIKGIEQFILDKINDAAKKLYYALFPGEERSKLKKQVDTVNDLIACLFRKIVSNLFKMVGEFLKTIVERFINAPLCAIENFVSSLLGKLTGLITSALGIILAPLNAILGVVNVVGDIFGLIENILSFLSCDDKPACPEIKKWSIWDGPEKSQDITNANFSSIRDKAKTFASNIATSVDPNTFNFDLNFDDVFTDTCNVGPLLCGPPTVDFFGGSGSGASGNAIVSATGKIVGIDIINGGSGYSSAPIVKLTDSCGKGSGAVANAIINNGQVTGAIIKESGSKYLPAQDGSLGGDGDTWAKNSDTTVQRKDGKFDVPYPPGENIQINEGDKVRFPTGTSVNVGGQIINGGNYITSTKTASITTPPPSDSASIFGTYATLGTGKYPVILTLCEARVGNVGINYSPTDKIIIEPANGAEATPVFGSFGTLSEVKIISTGTGFTEKPKIYIESETGYNSEIIPILCVTRVGENEIKDPTYQDKIISVIDCVGKV